MNFRKTNNLVGWLVFVVSLITYWLTMEETASYWDCGEFIAVSYKLEVSHPPGAPLYMLLGRLFSFLAFGDVTKVAYWVNFLSVLVASLTILFLFWSITLFGRKLMGIKNDSEITDSQVYTIIGAGVIGSLAYTFSDSFWFSAVEAEVYAMTAFFTALTVWGVLKWDVIEDESIANRWLLFIAYIIGLSIGVHMLNLVTIPALALIYYFHKYKITRWGIVATMLISGGLVLFINDLIVPGLPSLAGNFEIFFVNNLNMFFGSGVIVFCLLIAIGLTYGIYYSHKNNKVELNIFFLSTAFILIGYGSYTTIVIRSNYNTAINENSPKDVMSFVRYLKREQYGSRPLLFGTYFTDNPIAVKEGAPVYIKGKDKYEISYRQTEYEYEPGAKTIFPRAWEPEGKDSYESIMNLKKGQRPTFVQNIAYMFKHQISYMYMRYFMWNFAGRASDLDGAGWLSPFDAFRKVPQALAQNKARNNFFMLPFLLGFFGMFYQFTKDTKGFFVLILLFLMTGIAIVVYLNPPPVEPRERDYIYAGSTYAFTFWIGLGVIGIADYLNRIIKNKKTCAILATVCCLCVPTIMGAVGWDDHNRHGRFFSVDSGKNYLASCDPNAILFTGGDNDTFMLWYSQEVEGFRTDLRVLVLSYYNTDWYIEQSMMKSYESEPLPYTLSLYDYRQGGPNDALYYTDLGIPSIDIKEYLSLLKKGYQSLRRGEYNIVPAKVLTLTIDKEKILKMGIIPPGMDSLVVDKMEIKLKDNYLHKQDLAFLDLLATSDWTRPIYLNVTSISQLNLDLNKYLVQDGNAYRVLPVFNNDENREFLVDTESTYNKMINDFKYRGLDNPSLYFTDDYRGFVQNHRSSLNSLADAFFEAKNIEKAKEVLYFSIQKMPDKVINYDISTLTTIDLFFELGEKKTALEIAKVMTKRAEEMCNYELEQMNTMSMEFRRNMYIIGGIQEIMVDYNEEELATELKDKYQKLLFQSRGDNSSN